MRARIALLIAAFAWGCGWGCGDEPKAIVYRAPVHSRAEWVLEPTTIEIGDVATLELAIAPRFWQIEQLHRRGSSIPLGSRSSI